MDPVHKKLHTHIWEISELHKLSAIRLCGSYSTRSDQYLPPRSHTAIGLTGMVAREKERDTNTKKERKQKKKMKKKKERERDTL